MKAVIRTLVAAAVVGGCFAPCRAAGEEADDVIAALDVEIAGVDAGQDGTADAKPSKVAVKKAPMAVLKDANHAEATGYGEGKTKHDAKLAAFRSAIENAVGVYVDAESVMKNYEMVKDRVNTISNGDITNYETIKEGQKDGLYFIEIKALVEKKAIAPKFADVFPDAFADISSETGNLHAKIMSEYQRTGDAAKLMVATLKDVDPMLDWTRLSVVKGGLRKVQNVGKFDRGNVKEVAGKGLYSLRYSITIDRDAYFKGFLPHFKEVLSKMQEGAAEEDVSLEACLMTEDPMPANIRMMRDELLTDFVEPVVLSGFPDLNYDGISYWSAGGIAEKIIKGGLTHNIWLLDKMNKSQTAFRCSAYKVPEMALKAYWVWALFGDFDSPRHSQQNIPERLQKVELVLLDKDGEEIASKVDRVPFALMFAGLDERKKLATESFESFFVRPLFVYNEYVRGKRTAYSSEIQREVHFQLTHEQLGEVKKAKCRFVRSKKVRGKNKNNKVGGRNQESNVSGKKMRKQ